MPIREFWQTRRNRRKRESGVPARAETIREQVGRHLRLALAGTRYRREIWRTLRWSDGYEVSTLGRVRAVGSAEVKPATLATNGSLVVNLYWKRRSSVRAIHTLVAETFLGPRPAGWMVRHIDGNKTNCRLSNLEYVPMSFREPRNEHERGRYLVGKLTRAQASQIRRRAQAGESVQTLAHEYGVSSPMISDIKHGRKWRESRDV